MPISSSRKTSKKRAAKKKQPLRVNKLLSYLPDALINEFVEETGADKYVKRLKSIYFLKLLLFGVLKSNKLSTHLLEHYYNSGQFSQLSGKGGHQTRHSSIADRLKALPPALSQKLFGFVSTHLFDKFFKGAEDKKSLTIKSFDSSMITASAALLKEGMRIGGQPKNGPGTKQLKLSVSLCNGFPEQVSLHAEQSYLSEDVALGELVLKSSKKDKQVLVFDRGISSRETFDKLTGEEKLFVTRINTHSVYQVAAQNELPEPQTPTLLLKQDLLVKLRNNKGQWSQHVYRLIKAINKESGEEIWFLSNMEKVSALQITELYRQRWQIEVFFKFLKQHLHLENLLSYELKAIETMLYIRIIVAALILVYKKENELTNFKTAKEKFTIELEMDLIEHLILLCGGDPKKLTQSIGYHKLW